MPLHLSLHQQQIFVHVIVTSSSLFFRTGSGYKSLITSCSNPFHFILLPVVAVVIVVDPLKSINNYRMYEGDR